MFSTEDQDVDVFFSLSIGSANPFWTLTHDSNVLQLGNSPTCADITSELSSTETAQIRQLEDEPQEVACSALLHGRQFRFYLVGRRVSENKWRGVASATRGFRLTEAMNSALSARPPSNVFKLPSKRLG
ncbi:hypothetical protein [Burkholderia stagnalis]|uniref:hypothetical protein n=1 Tax=Burkholderia stagnalis TaxID=1503054 RepID=UPI00075F95C5|nr:hypothetical protein [Burkholderia stagnalis]KWN82980.1 hypothetical protein WT91_29470 [Burkholderia stagnalis]KWN96002.1 hypothetical protein WT92_16065 [Burkholderia stagnalis]